MKTKKIDEKLYSVYQELNKIHVELNEMKNENEKKFHSWINENMEIVLKISELEALIYKYNFK